MTKLNRVIGIATTIFKFIENNGQDIFFPCIFYHLTQLDVRIFSPQTYHQMHCGHSIVQGNQVTMHLPFHRIHIPVDLSGTNLPVVHNSFVTGHDNKILAQGSMTKPQIDVLIIDRSISIFQPGLKDSYNKLGVQVSHTHNFLITNLYTKLLKILNSRLIS